jgi:predicted metal-dependent HD superfamily phosphohydrolase
MTENQVKILSEAEKFVKEIFRKKLNPLFVFHNLPHTKQVVNAATEIAKHYQLNDDDLFVLLLAAWFHDTGFSAGQAEEHEKESIRLASDFLLRNTDTEIVHRVSSCIQSTRIPQSPQNLVEKIMCDADLYHLGTHKFRKMNNRLKKEQQAYFIKEFSKKEWSDCNIGFLESHEYFTDYCRHKLEPLIKERIRDLQKNDDRHDNNNRNVSELNTELQPDSNKNS